MHRPRTAGLASLAILASVVAPAATTTAHASSVAYVGIRPGSVLVLHDVVGGNDIPTHACVANFVFQTTAGAFDPSQQLYIGTAGHCVDADETVYALVVPPSGGAAVEVEVGTVIVDNDVLDFALVEIDPALNGWVSPSTAHWGGPTGTYAFTSADVPVRWVGVGGTPRAGLLTSYFGTDIDVTTVDLTGDSGAPVLTADGLAVGSLTGVRSIPPPVAGFAVGTDADGPRIDYMIAAAGKPLATCPTATPWPLPGCPAA